MYWSTSNWSEIVSKTLGRDRCRHFTEHRAQNVRIHSANPQGNYAAAVRTRLVLFMGSRSIVRGNIAIDALYIHGSLPPVPSRDVFEGER